jgi:hypothetical protein
MRLIAAPLIMEIAPGVASHPIGVVIIPAILAPEAPLQQPVTGIGEPPVIPH